MASRTFQVSLPRELSSYIERQIKNGRYHDASDVVREALRKMEAAEIAAELSQFERAFAGGHDRAETAEEIRRIDRAVKAGQK